MKPINKNNNTKIRREHAGPLALALRPTQEKVSAVGTGRYETKSIGYERLPGHEVCILILQTPSKTKDQTGINKEKTTTFGCVEVNPGPPTKGAAATTAVKGPKKNKKPQQKQAMSKSQAMTSKAINSQLNSMKNLLAKEHAKPKTARLNDSEALAELFLASLVAPDPNRAPQRWSSTFTGTRPTAVASPWERRTAVWTTNANESQIQAFGFRDVSRHTVTKEWNDSSRYYRYDFYFTSQPLSLSSEPVALPQQEVSLSWWIESTEQAPARYTFHPVYGLASSNTGTYPYRPHGTHLLAGTVDGDASSARLVYLEADNTVSYSFNRVPFTGTDKVVGRLSIAKLQGGDIVEDVVRSDVIDTSNAASLSGDFDVESSGYYRIDFVWEEGNIASTTNATFWLESLDIVGNDPVWCHRPCPGFIDNVAAAKATRTIGHSLMYTNNAAPLVKQGKICAVQLPVGSIWDEYTDFDTVTSVAGSVQLTADNGIYISARPSQPYDLDMHDYYTSSAGQLVDSYYPIIPKSGVLTVCASITSVSGRDATWTVCDSLEYETNDLWRASDLPALSSQMCTFAMEVAKSVPQITENPTHLTRILSQVRKGIKSVAEGVLHYAPDVIDAVNKYGPLVMRAATMV